MVGGGWGCPLLREIFDQSDPPLQNDEFQSIFARTASAKKTSEKSSIFTNRKSTTRFPMSPKLRYLDALLHDRGLWQLKITFQDMWP